MALKETMAGKSCYGFGQRGAELMSEEINHVNDANTRKQYETSLESKRCHSKIPRIL